MPQYNWQGIDRAGKKVSGQGDVKNEGELRMQLRTQGVRPTKISPVTAMNKDLGSLFRGPDVRLNLQQLLSFTRQLQVLISAGIPVVQGLEVLEEQSIERPVKKLFGSLKEKVSGGMFLWEAMSQHGKSFPKMYIALVRAGEFSGSIDQMLSRLGRYLESSERTRRIVKKAMIYPSVVLTVGIGVILVMLMFVIPKFEDLLKSSNQELPAVTQMVISSSHFLIGHAGMILGTIATVGFLGFRFLKTDEGRAFRDQLFFRLPLFGALMQRAGTARFSRTLGTLLSSGVNLIEAIDICRATIDNTVLEAAVGRIRGEVEAGKTLGTVIGKLKVFPRMAVQMISVGEATGALDKMLEKVADFYEEEVEVMVSSMTTLIEPLMLVFLGGSVGGLMIAMYLPIFKLAGAASGGP